MKRVVAEARDAATTFVRDVMSTEVRCCFEHDSVEEVAVKMSQWHDLCETAVVWRAPF